MNRTQAENLLDAYTAACSMFPRKDDDDAFALGDVCDALRDVIVDAMCETRCYPYITTPIAPTPAIKPEKPYVTWTGEDTLGNRSTWEGVNANAD